MFISQELRKNNIAEYLLYMWQIEDLIRAYGCSLSRIRHEYIEQFAYTDEQKEEMTDWYGNLVRMMNQEGCRDKGHLQINKIVMQQLVELNAQLLQSTKFPFYNSEYYKVLPFIVELRKRGADNAENERVIVYSGTMNIGGSALAAQQGIDVGNREIPVVPEGQPLSIAFEGFHEYGGRVWYDIGNGFVELGVSGGGNFAKGFGDAPADIPGFLVHVPHETAHDVAHVFGVRFGNAVDDAAQSHGGAVAGQRLQRQAGDERPHGGQAVVLYFRQMILPVFSGQQRSETSFQGAHARRAAFRCFHSVSL